MTKLRRLVEAANDYKNYRGKLKEVDTLKVSNPRIAGEELKKYYKNKPSFTKIYDVSSIKKGNDLNDMHFYAHNIQKGGWDAVGHYNMDDKTISIFIE